MSKVILACHDESLRTELRSHIEAFAPASHLEVVPYMNMADAQRGTNHDTKLVVTTIHLPKDYATSVQPGEQLGLDYLSWLKTMGFEIPALLIAKRTPDVDRIRNDAVVNTYKTLVVEEGPELFDKFVDALESAIRGIPKTKKYLKIRIFLKEPPGKSRYHCVGHGFRDAFDTGRQELRLDEAQVRLLKYWARDVGAGQNWHASFSNYGTELGALLFEQNPHFRNHVLEGMRRENLHPSATKLSFIIERNLHQMVFESMKAPDDVADLPAPADIAAAPDYRPPYWALKAPLYRKISTRASYQPLFRGEDARSQRPINCLIINANLREQRTFEDIKVDSKTPLSLGPLENADSECNEVERILKDNRIDFRIKHIKSLKAAPDIAKFSSYVMRELREAEEPWHFVHFCGHSHYDPINEKGYVFFQDHEPTAIGIDEFSEALRYARFVFLNSCQSAEADFVYELVRHRVPAVSGFRWVVNDKMAAEYAQVFYRSLFKVRSLERAFTEARVYASEQYPDDPLWASSMLVMQA